MSFHDCLIVERPEEWFIVVGDQTERLAAQVDTGELVICVGLMLARSGLKGPRCLIAPAATSCFFTSIPGGPDVDVRDRNALRYELESHLPLDAETMVADYVVRTMPGGRPKSTDGVPADPKSAGQSHAGQSHDDRNEGRAASRQIVSAIAVEFARWRELADALELSGIVVRSIVPSALLAARALSHSLNPAQRTELLLFEPTRCDAVTFETDSVTAWKHLAVDRSTLRQHHILDNHGVKQVVVAAGDGEQLEQVREAYGDVEVKVVDRPLESLWIEGTEATLTKPSPRWFDLRRDQLGPGDPLRPVLPQLRLATAAAFACLLAIAIGGWWRNQQIETTVEQLRSQQVAAYSSAFPDSPVPVALLRRVKSEHAEVIGSRGASAEIEVPVSATDVLTNFLAALPESVRFQAKGLKVLNGHATMDLQVRSTVDAGVLAAALKAHGFEVEPPITTRFDTKTFDSVLEATWKGSASADGETNR